MEKETAELGKTWSRVRGENRIEVRFKGKIVRSFRLQAEKKQTAFLPLLSLMGSSNLGRGGGRRGMWFLSIPDDSEINISNPRQVSLYQSGKTSYVVVTNIPQSQ